LEVSAVQPDPDVRKELRLAEGEIVSAISILFLANDQPAIYITYFLSTELSQHTIDWTSFDGSMIDTVERVFSQRIHQTQAHISAVNASKDLAKKLHIDEGRAILRFATSALLVDGRIAYYSVSYQDSDMLEVRVIRRRNLSPSRSH
jgi:DNA-binding GntR family transcriptional regulator